MENTIEFSKKYISIIIGSLIFAAGLEFFLIPNNILDGGVIGYKQIGKGFSVASVFGIIVLSVATSYLHKFPPLITDPFLACVFGGIILGIGVGLVIRNGGTLDGSEMFSIYATKKLPISVGEMVLGINVIIFIASGFVFSWEAALYSMISYFIASKVMDIVIEGLNDSKSVMIISSNYQVISQEIQDRLGRGVTLLHGEGGYTGHETKIIFCVITRIEESKLKKIVFKNDRGAFLSIGTVSEVSGGNFKKKDIH